MKFARGERLGVQWENHINLIRWNPAVHIHIYNHVHAYTISGILGNSHHVGHSKSLKALLTVLMYMSNASEGCYPSLLS